MENIIVAEGLRKEYDGFALEDVSFRVPGGAIMGLIGENGAGKTTTIKCILNLIRRDAGEITLLGRDNLREERAAKAGVGVVLDECVFHDALRPRDLERILAPVYPTWDNGLYRDYLDKFRLPGKNLIKTFSRGMKMKLSLAAALAHRPQLLILDEATANIDTETELLIQDSLEKMRTVGTMLIVAHRLSTIQHADNIIVLSHGKILEQGTHQQLLARHGRYYQLYTLQYHKAQLNAAE